MNYFIKNGSGKTVLLNAISDFLNIIKNDKSAEDENLYGRVDVQSDLLGSIAHRRGIRKTYV